jgi:predicted transcriptional regulator YheO
VIIHDARTRSILHVSGRLDGINKIAHYENPNRGGEQIRSITSVLKNDKGEPEALLCINVNFSALDTAVAVLTHF